jgi:Na+:H+ antiporter, NhaC family
MIAIVWAPAGARCLAATADIAAVRSAVSMVIFDRRALMGVGAGLGLPLPLVAGAVLRGPISVTRTPPTSHRRWWAPISTPTSGTCCRPRWSRSSLSLALYLWIGFSYAESTGDLGRVTAILATMQAEFVINPILILPPLLVMVVSFKRMPAIPGIALGAIAGLICAFLVQGATYETAMNAAFSGYVSESGNADVDDLLSRGGLESMLFTISLIIAAMMFGGVMQKTGQLRVIAERILQMANSTGSLVLSTALTAIGSNFLLCDQYMSLVMTGRMYIDAYRERGLAPENLSRVTEDAGTVTDPLVPWGSGGAYQTATLGVATIAYFPFAFFCWISPLVTILYGYTGWTIKPLAAPAETPVPVPVAPATS